MARVNESYVVEDPSDDELNDGRTLTLRARGQGRRRARGVDAATIVRRTFVFL